MKVRLLDQIIHKSKLYRLIVVQTYLSCLLSCMHAIMNDLTTSDASRVVLSGKAVDVLDHGQCLYCSMFYGKYGRQPTHTELEQLYELVFKVC